MPAQGACIITPNHVTYADPIWITIPIKRRIYYMAWDKLFNVPVLGALMRMFGAFPVKLEGADMSAQREAIDLLGNGKALVIFPEGGRTKTGEVMPYKIGAFRLAITLGIPVVPVAIKGGYEIWPANRWFPQPGSVTITYFPPISVQRQPDSISNIELKEKATLLAKTAHDIVAEEVRTYAKLKA